MKLCIFKAFVAVLALFCVPAVANAQSRNLYQDKAITLIVPNSAAGNMSRYARLIAPYIASHAGAREVRVTNITGAGGLVGTNRLWRAKPDGMTIAFTSASVLMLAQLAGSPAVQFDATKFVYLGHASGEPRLLAVGGKSPIKSIQEVRKLDRPFVFPAQGVDEDFYTMAVLADALNFRMKVVTGYEGIADTALAVMKGEADGHITGAYQPATLGPIKAGDKRPILVIGAARLKDFPDVPTILEVVPAEKRPRVQAIVDMLMLEREFFGPPNMEPRATEALRRAITAALADPALKAEAAKQHIHLAPMDGLEVHRLVQQMTKEAANLTPILQEAVKAVR